MTTLDTIRRDVALMMKQVMEDMGYVCRNQ